MLEYTYTSSGIIAEAQKYGFNYTADFDSRNSIITAGVNNFYGPVRFIGYIVRQYLWDSINSIYTYRNKEAKLYFGSNQVLNLNIEPDSIVIISDTDNYLYYSYKKIVKSFCQD